MCLPDMHDITGDENERRHGPKKKNKRQDVDAVVHFPHRNGGLYGNDRFYDVAVDGAAGGSGQKTYPPDCRGAIVAGQ
ncbi:hypothetical protein OUHCRE19_11710 [Enterobacter asburiae]